MPKFDLVRITNENWEPMSKDTFEEYLNVVEDDDLYALLMDGGLIKVGPKKFLERLILILRRPVWFLLAPVDHYGHAIGVSDQVRITLYKDMKLICYGYRKEETSYVLVQADIYTKSPTPNDEITLMWHIIDEDTPDGLVYPSAVKNRSLWYDAGALAQYIEVNNLPVINQEILTEYLEEE